MYHMVLSVIAAQWPVVQMQVSYEAERAVLRDCG